MLFVRIRPVSIFTLNIYLLYACIGFGEIIPFVKALSVIFFISAPMQPLLKRWLEIQ